MSTDTISGISPGTNKENKHWWITIQIARLVNYLSLTRIIGRIIPKRLSDWAKVLIYNLSPGSPSKAGYTVIKPKDVKDGVEIEKNEGLGSKVEVEVEVKDKKIQTDPAPTQEEGGFQTDSLLPELEKEVDELRSQVSNQQNLQLELDRLRAQLEVPPKELLTLRDTLQNVKQEREKLEENVEDLKKEIIGLRKKRRNQRVKKKK